MNVFLFGSFFFAILVYIPNTLRTSRFAIQDMRRWKVDLKIPISNFSLRTFQTVLNCHSLDGWNIGFLIGEPNDGDGSSNCVEAYLSNGEWNDHWCGEDIGVVCKYRCE